MFSKPVFLMRQNENLWSKGLKFRFDMNQKLHTGLSSSQFTFSFRKDLPFFFFFQSYTYSYMFTYKFKSGTKTDGSNGSSVLCHEIPSYNSLDSASWELYQYLRRMCGPMENPKNRTRDLMAGRPALNVRTMDTILDLSKFKTYTDDIQMRQNSKNFPLIGLKTLWERP